ncbi:DUF2243 domain-containing protein [Kineococcus rubinsiae]|uniref:DUF2243 domain-containing protein n=1 Tax=Kineococcus rubinsiae TaxID=2609562 RepID=UPI0014321634|nr:DUF2243 domain-containing protein [Kineococcus rubinsiae]
MGVGLAAFLDEVVFHQLLHWHHFYDGAGPDAGLVSDGFFHAAGWIAVVAGLFTYADLQRRGETVRRPLVGGVLAGWGGFQVYDGLVQHKLLGLHQIRYGVDLAAYDVAWNTAGGIGLVVGLLLLTRPARDRVTGTA